MYERWRERGQQRKQTDVEGWNRERGREASIIEMKGRHLLWGATLVQVLCCVSRIASHTMQCSFVFCLSRSLTYTHTHGLLLLLSVLPFVHPPPPSFLYIRIVHLRNFHTCTHLTTSPLSCFISVCLFLYFSVCVLVCPCHVTQGLFCAPRDKHQIRLPLRPLLPPLLSLPL